MLLLILIFALISSRKNSSKTMLEPNRTHFQSCRIIGQCCNQTGSVELMKYYPSDTLVAVKRLNLDRFNTREFCEELELLQNELYTTRQLLHPNVILYHIAFMTGSELLMVAPLMAYGSCQDLIRNHFAGGLPELAIAFILRDVLLGLDYIHKKGFIHRAIKASHILLSANGRACLTGLRYSYNLLQNGKRKSTVHSFPNSTARNLNWLSPEVLEQNMKGYGESSDIYSVGITLCELANGVEPFTDMPTTLMLMEKVRGSVPQLLDVSTVTYFKEYGFAPQPLELSTGNAHNEEENDIGVSIDAISSGDTPEEKRRELRKTMLERTLSENFHELTQLCLIRDPNGRPTATQLMLHPFFKQCRRSATTLPELLNPLVPITDNRTASHDDSTLLLTTESFGRLVVEPEKWDF